ncbi:hypothetical protein BOW20_02125 [Solemya velum gill symbiont]|nr:hypothetical protein BOW20_02125 [Solemya velum gill symbiont]
MFSLTAFMLGWSLIPAAFVLSMTVTRRSDGMPVKIPRALFLLCMLIFTGSLGALIVLPLWAEDDLGLAEALASGLHLLTFYFRYILLLVGPFAVTTFCLNLARHRKKNSRPRTGPLACYPLYINCYWSDREPGPVF